MITARSSLRKCFDSCGLVSPQSGKSSWPFLEKSKPPERRRPCIQKQEHRPLRVLCSSSDCFFRDYEGYKCETWLPAQFLSFWKRWVGRVPASRSLTISPGRYNKADFRIHSRCGKGR